MADKFLEITEHWQSDTRDPWCDGNELIFRCLFDQFDEIEQLLYVPEDAQFCHNWREQLAEAIYAMILGGYNAEGSSEGFEE